MFSINHIVYIDSSGMVSYGYQGMMGTFRSQSLQMPAKGLHCQHDFLKIIVSGLLLTLLHSIL